MDAKMLELARIIHREVCGCDDKTCNTTTEIYNWLVEGEPDDFTIAELVELWQEYHREE